MRRIAARIKRQAGELAPQVLEEPPGTEVFWIVVRTDAGQSLCFCRGDHFWEADTLEHVRGEGDGATENQVTNLPATTTDPDAVAATVISVARGYAGTGALTKYGSEYEIALRTAVSLWSDTTTSSETLRRVEIMRDKESAVRSFFDFARRHPADVTPVNVQAWRSKMEGEGLKPATVYARISRVSSFYKWLMRGEQLGGAIRMNPVLLARPKAPRPYQGKASKALTDEQLRKLAAVVRGKAAAGSIVAKRDYALLMLYAVTGLRRSEVINLRGNDLEEDGGTLVLHTKVKGGDYVERELCDPEAQDALREYVSASGRDFRQLLATARPIWTRHDPGGKDAVPLTSHAFAHNLKLYAAEAGIKKIHVHQLRHTFGRKVADATGSISEVQEALGHRDLSTTRVYVQRIGRKRDKHSQMISKSMKDPA